MNTTSKQSGTPPDTTTAKRTAEAAAVRSSDLLAWMVEINSMTCVVFAATKAKAQWIATKSYWDAYGRRKGEWPRAKAWRAKPYDKSRLRFEKQRAWSEEHVMDAMNANDQAHAQPDNLKGTNET